MVVSINHVSRGMENIHLEKAPGTAIFRDEQINAGSNRRGGRRIPARGDGRFTKEVFS